MPILRKIIKIGQSRAITIPHDFIRYYENQGKLIKEVILEINDKGIFIQPMLEDVVKNHCDIEKHVDILTKRGGL